MAGTTPLETKCTLADDTNAVSEMNYENLCHLFAKTMYKKKVLDEELHMLYSYQESLREESCRQYQASEIEEENAANRLLRKLEVEESNLHKYERLVLEQEEKRNTLASTLRNARQEETNIQNQLEASQELFLMTLQRNMMDVAQNNNNLSQLLWNEKKKFLSLIDSQMQKVAHQQEQERKEVKKEEEEQELPASDGETNDDSSKKEDGLSSPELKYHTPENRLSDKRASRSPSIQNNLNSLRFQKVDADEGKEKRQEMVPVALSPYRNSIASSGNDTHPRYPLPSSSFLPPPSSGTRSSQTQMPISTQSTPSTTLASSTTKSGRTALSFNLPYIPTAVSPVAGAGLESFPCGPLSTSPFAVGNTALRMSSSSSLFSSRYSSTFPSSFLPYGNKANELGCSHSVIPRQSVSEGPCDGAGDTERGGEEEGKGETAMDVVPGSPTATVPIFFLDELRHRIDVLMAQNDAKAREDREGEKVFQELVKKFSTQQEEVSQARAEAERLRQHLKLLQKRYIEMHQRTSVSSRGENRGLGSMSSVISHINSGSLFLHPEDSLATTPELMSLAQTPKNQKSFFLLDSSRVTSKVGQSVQ